MQNGGNYTSNTAQSSDSGVDSVEYKGLIRSLGKNGQKAYADSVKSLIRNNPNASELEILRNFNRYYIGALVGKSRAEINENYADRVPDEVKKLAYNAGVADRKSEINNQRKMANSEVIKNGGLIENDYSEKLSDKQKEYISGLAKKLGVAVEIVDSVKTESGAEANGEYVNGIIRLSQKTINENPSEAVKFILAHEVSHRIKALAPKEFQKFSDLAVKYAAKKTGKSAVDIISDRVTERSKKGNNVDIPGATEEIAADVAGQFFDEGFLTYAAQENYTLMDKIRGYLFDLLDTLGIRKYTDIEALKRTWDKALQTAQNQVKKQSNYAENSKVESSKASERQVKYSITEIKGKNGNYGIGVKLDTDKFSNKKPRNWNKVLTEYVYKNLAGQTLEIQDEKGNREKISFAKLNERIKKDGAKNSHKVIDKLVRTKGNINTLSIIHIDELLETSKFTGSTDEHNHQWLDENGWIHRKTYVQDLNGNIYETTLNIAKARDGRNILYALSNTKKVDDGAVSSASNEEGLAHKHQLSKGSVPQQKQKVKPQNKKSVGEINPFEQENSFDNDDMVYKNKEKTSRLFSDIGLQLPKRLNNLRFDTIIHQSRNIVNGKVFYFESKMKNKGDVLANNDINAPILYAQND